jgi:hypothetical protein
MFPPAFFNELGQICSVPEMQFQRFWPNPHAAGSVRDLPQRTGMYMDILTALTILGLVISFWRFALRFSRVTTGAVGYVAKSLGSSDETDTASSNLERLEAKMLEAADVRAVAPLQSATPAAPVLASNIQVKSFGKRG